jgi:hypothetical protein
LAPATKSRTSRIFFRFHNIQPVNNRNRNIPAGRQKVAADNASPEYKNLSFTTKYMLKIRKKTKIISVSGTEAKVIKPGKDKPLPESARSF